MAPNGFVDRFKGKVEVDPNSSWVGGIPMYGTVTQLNAVPTSTGSTITIGRNTVARINASSTTAFVRLPSISFVGQPLAIEIFGYGSTSTSVFITAATGQAFIGSSYNVLRSTQNLTIEFQATSTLNWSIMGTFSTSNSSTGGAYAPTLSTTT